MKKLLLTLALLLGFVSWTSAEIINMKIIARKKNDSPISGSVGRGPIMNLSIDMTFNDETGELTVVSEETLNGCVYVMNMEGEQECY